MNRIAKAFDGKKAFIAFITGGDPDIETTEKLVLGMAEAGADIIEIGVPFSDPIAEGPVIQNADERALKAGCTADGLFEAVKRIRPQTGAALMLMTYANPVYAYGKERFMANCREAGIDGVIIPDAPFEEKAEFEECCKRFGICLISMIAPTSGGRAQKIARSADGFLYCVSSLGVTGTRGEIGTEISRLIEEVRQVSDIPCAVGFGVSTPQQAGAMAAISDGVIVGSAIVKIVARHGRSSAEPVKRFVADMVRAIK